MGDRERQREVKRNSGERHLNRSAWANENERIYARTLALSTFFKLQSRRQVENERHSVSRDSKTIKNPSEHAWSKSDQYTSSQRMEKFQDSSGHGNTSQRVKHLYAQA